VRTFSYITVGKILEELRDEGVSLTRVTFYRLEKRLKFPKNKSTTGILKWRVYTRKQADAVKNKIKEEYALEK